MSRGSYHLALLRQWEMLMRLPSGPPGVTARALTEILKECGFAVSKRTVERDLDHLSASFSIVCNDISKPYG